MTQKVWVFFIVLVQIVLSESYYYKGHQKVTLEPIKNTASRSKDIHFYKTVDGIRLGITDKILVKLYSGQDLEPLLQKYHLQSIKSLGRNLYLLKANSIDSTLEIANALDREQGVVYAHPDFIKQRVLR